MSKSYREPWGTWVSCKVSERFGKTTASRGVRRAQNQEIVAAWKDDSWDEFILPVRLEVKMGNPYDLRRDGTKRPLYRSRQYNNPYAYWMCRTAESEEEIIERWRERQKNDDDYLAYASRK